MRFISVFALVLSLSLPAFAQTALETAAREAIVVDYNTGAVLLEKNADEQMPPSSMSKLMTAYVVFMKLKDGSLKLSDELQVSQKAWALQGSKMFVAIDSRVKVEDLLRGMIIQSGNDACVVLAEGISGSEEAFAELMNKTAKEIGMRNSNFVNATGWPDQNHYMTARDLATLAAHLVHDFPEYMHYYKEKDFKYNNIKQGNRNPLLYGYPGGDGLKTGHTDIAGYGLVGTAERDGRRLIAVFNGVNSMQARADEARKLLDWGYREFRNIELFKPEQIVGSADIWMGLQPKVDLQIKQHVLFTVPSGMQKNMNSSIVYMSPLKAPIAKGTQVAVLRLEMGAAQPMDIPLYAAEDVARKGFFSRMWSGFNYFMSGDAS